MRMYCPARIRRGVFVNVMDGFNIRLPPTPSRNRKSTMTYAMAYSEISIDSIELVAEQKHFSRQQGREFCEFH